MPPTNDNFGSAQDLGTGEFASVMTMGNNFGATTESGEPSSNGKTVWYKWTPATTNMVVFATAQTTCYPTSPSAPSSPVLATVLQIFKGSSLSALTEAAPGGGTSPDYFGYYGSIFKQRFGGWDLGSLVRFNAVAGTTYYIRVDGASTVGVTAVSGIITGGKNYAVNDTVGVDGNGQIAKLTVTSVGAGGAITGASISYAGSYSTSPSATNHVVTLSGSGSGAVIRITSGSITAEGNFALFWGTWMPQLYGGCGGCPPSLNLQYKCIGTVTPDILTDSGTWWAPAGYTNSHTVGTSPKEGNKASFGTQPKGQYVLKYCTGAYNSGISPPLWTVMFNAASYYSGSGSNINLFEGFVLRYFNSGTQTDTPAMSPSTFGRNCVNQLQAEQQTWKAMLMDGTLDCQLGFTHSGGDISVFLAEPNFADNSDGSPSPTFSLFRVVPNFAVTAAVDSWVTTGSSCKVVMYMDNKDAAAWSSVTASLDSAGGVSGSSSQTISSISAYQTGIKIVLTFNSSSLTRTGTLRLSCADFPADVLISVPFVPLNITFLAACTAGATGNPSVSSQWRNGNIISFATTMTIDVAGAVTGSGSTAFTLAASGNTTARVSFNSSSFPVVTVRLSCSDWGGDITQTVNTNPLMVLTFTDVGPGTCSPSGLAYERITANISVAGNYSVPSGSQCTLTFSPHVSATRSLGSCFFSDVSGSDNVNPFGPIVNGTCNASGDAQTTSTIATGSITLDYHRTGTTQTISVTAALQSSSGTTLISQTGTITIPP